jgi:type II restriction enzyme
LNNRLVIKWIKSEYVNSPKPLFKYSIILPKANNTGKFGEVLSQPIMTEPGIGSTETFLSIGYFDTEEEDKNCLKYISTKYARAMLGILKTTQDLTPDKWKYVPVQDFTSSSDIDWSKSVHEIDLQLYRKYGLSVEEINFIETHVKEMV